VRVAVIGANGQLGSDICAAFAAQGAEVLPLTHADVEIASEHSVRSVLGTLSPGLVVNTAAMHNVERCEENPAAAFAVNATGACHLARFAAHSRCALLHISTDYVFDGAHREPYVEDDPPMPLNVYGNSKLAGELMVRTIAPRHFVLRVSGLYGRNPCRAKGGLNFVERMLQLAAEREEVRVVDDEFLTPTSTAEVARQVVVLAATSHYALYHATAEGSCSWLEFAREIFRVAGVTTRLEAARPGEFPAKVPRPKYSVLENRALKRQGLNVFRDWRVGLREYLAARTAAAQLTGQAVAD
jgi:dTDP-4-dehydrorhamnose reductase